MNIRKKHLWLILILFFVVLLLETLYIFQLERGENLFTDKSEEKSNIIISNDDPEENPPAEAIIVHVAGAVKQGGVYKLTDKKRVIDALRMAGGKLSTADLASINLAAPVADGERIYIPFRKNQAEKRAAATSNGGRGIAVSSEGGQELININSASGRQLQELSGIGPSKAESIIEYREKVGVIKKISQLENVSGIGPKTLEKIRNELTLH